MKRLIACSSKSRIYSDIPGEIQALLNQTYNLHYTYSNTTAAMDMDTERRKEKKLLTLRKPHVHKDLQQDILTSTASP